jgi:two-component system response regulator FixJ
MADADAKPVIILVDDDQAVLNALTFALELDGFEVRAFANGKAVLELQDLPPLGCLVFDYNMPEINGLELLQRLRAGGVELPAILMTASPTKILREGARAAGVPLIEKPFFGQRERQRYTQLTSRFGACYPAAFGG